MTELRRTPLYNCHVASKAKFTEFGGWEMPVQYSGLADEHLTVRQCAGLFDVSHMGEVTVKGKDALSFLQYLTSNDVSKLVPGKAQYSLLLNQQGGVVDDIIIYKIAEDDYFLCVNAANTDKDFAWIKQHQKGDVVVENVSAHYAQIALQGPAAIEILALLCKVDAIAFSLEVFPSFTFEAVPVVVEDHEFSVMCARTGYTGEDGFELFVPAEHGAQVWDALLELGAPYGLKPIGLGARDTLRLEVCYPLHGHELTDEIPALCSAVSWVIKMDKEDFIGKEALLAAKQNGLPYKLVGLAVTGRGIVRHESKLFNDTQEVGWVTSGTIPPTVNRAVGLGFVPESLSKIGTALTAEVRGKKVAVEVIKTPFLKK